MALATIATIAAGLIKGGVLRGWFGGGEDWVDDVLGRKYSTEGSVLDELEDETGRTYPALREELNHVVSVHKQIKECWFSAKAKKIQRYQELTGEFAQHVADEWAAHQGSLGGIPGLENILASIIKSPFVIVGLVFFFVIGILLFTMARTRKKR